MGVRLAKGEPVKIRDMKFGALRARVGAGVAKLCQPRTEAAGLSVSYLAAQQ